MSWSSRSVKTGALRVAPGFGLGLLLDRGVLQADPRLSRGVRHITARVQPQRPATCRGRIVDVEAVADYASPADLIVDELPA